ncbi:ferrous iron transport protein B [Bacteroides sp. UBA939]|uniref:ferrous iron transport protein B n=1 Tax=Bacteroides sp. UBA939 TaxID=1946092 RepID=UPI0025BAC2B6|nr:ferrous iron transport protein B [Bacteroides sp. UBA939]
MRYLSSLEDGETAVIAKINGSCCFRQRLTEMGFVYGTKVKAIKKAPLQDPVEYELMGYRVSLRQSEAAKIEIIEAEEVHLPGNAGGVLVTGNVDEALISANTGEALARQESKRIRVALVGNPNSGKTTLFNRATGKHERVGNYSGVTVDIKTAYFNQQDYRIDLTDLPGTYSISEYTPEELFVRKHLEKDRPDVVINVVDASNLERNLFLTTQLIDMNLRVVIALNMYDELQTKGDKFDYEHLGEMIHIPIVPTIASRGKGIGALLDKVIEVYEDSAPRHVHIRYNPDLSDSDARYAFIYGALKETYRHAEVPCEPKGYRPDKLLTHKWFGIPIFLLFMWAIFQLTFTLGAYPMEWIEAGVGALGDWIQTVMPDGMLKDLLVDGIIGGVGGVIVFLPNILILFFCISLMEDTGYMARAAFIMDKAMHKIGLHGKSFIPMLMGFGCGVPAIMATRTLHNRKDRILTMLAVPLMSCSARLPVYILFISAFFPTGQGLILLSIYVIGVLLAGIMTVVLHKILFKKTDAPFVMELPPYRIPTLRNIGIHTWGKSVQYLTKMGTVILVASILIWALGYFPQSSEVLPEDASEEMVIAHASTHLENSYIGRLGHAIEPVIEPLGYDWKIGVSLLTGLAAKEIVVSSMGILYQTDLEADESSVALREKLQEHTFTSGPHAGEKVFTPLIAYSLMLFILLYLPCFAALAAIRREAGTHWAVFAMCYTTGLAWLVAFGGYQVGSVF